ncbi:DUF4917 family protein [Mollicutes bacterium LVI A0078]|nr:DUF4917 family protein [Mollicutes bacterium LVI A0075]WOO91174.1 DUF4917 family protein [Mollicutes bacterium LVI A0078]
MEKFKTKFIVDFAYISKKDNVNLLIGNGFSKAMEATFDYSETSKNIVKKIQGKVDKTELDIIKNYLMNIQTTEYSNIEEFIYELMKLKACFELCERDEDEISELDALYKYILSEFISEIANSGLKNSNRVINDNINKIYSTNYLFEFQNYCNMCNHTNYISYLIKDYEYASGLNGKYIDYTDAEWKSYLNYLRRNNSDATNTILYHIHGGFITTGENVYGSINKWKTNCESPYVILDGTAAAKLDKIEANNYTKKCFENFKNQNGDLVVLGNSLATSDNHLIQNIENLLVSNKLGEVVIGIFCEEEETEGQFIYKIHGEIVKFKREVRDRIKFIRVSNEEKTIEQITFKN